MVSTAKVMQFLEGINFPANRQQVIDYAKDNNAPQDVIEMLQRLPEGIYYSMAGVLDAIGQAA